jgi:hypothetical protein
MSENIVPFTGVEPESSGPAPVAFRLDASDSLSDVIDVLALEVFAAGQQPYARTARLERVRPDAPLRPPGASVLRAGPRRRRRDRTGLRRRLDAYPFRGCFHRRSHGPAVHLRCRIVKDA